MIPFSWINTDYANPGAMNFAFVPNMTLPMHGVAGPASMNLSQLHVMQPPQVIINHGVPLAGFGGLIHGQIVSQPLEG